MQIYIDYWRKKTELQIEYFDLLNNELKKNQNIKLSNFEKYLEFVEINAKLLEKEKEINVYLFLYDLPITEIILENLDFDNQKMSIENQIKDLKDNFYWLLIGFDLLESTLEYTEKEIKEKMEKAKL